MSRYQQVPDEPAGSDDIAAPTVIEFTDLQRRLLDSLSDDEIRVFVEERDKLTLAVKAEKPLLLEQALNEAVAERMKPLVMKLAQEKGLLVDVSG